MEIKEQKDACVGGIAVILFVLLLSSFFCLLSCLFVNLEFFLSRAGGNEGVASTVLIKVLREGA